MIFSRFKPTFSHSLIFLSKNSSTSSIISPFIGSELPFMPPCIRQYFAPYSLAILARAVFALISFSKVMPFSSAYLAQFSSKVSMLSFAFLAIFELFSISTADFTRSNSALAPIYTLSGRVLAPPISSQEAPLSIIWEALFAMLFSSTRLLGLKLSSVIFSTPIISGFGEIFVFGNSSFR